MPVLIICENRVDVDLLHKYIVKNLSKKTKKHKDLLGNKNRKVDSFVQIFAEVDDNNKEMNWNQIISNSTEVFSDTNMRRITVTDSFGGRGFDYDVRDKAANNEGGMLMIACTIPPGRDWVQWKGRTARGGM